MTPYYEQDGITIYHGDCLEIIPHLDLSRCVLVTDPPYGMGYVSGHLRQSMGPIAGDESPELRDRILELWGDGPAIVFGRWSVPRPRGVRQRLIWDKGDSPGMGDLSIPWGPGEEEIYVLGAGFVGPRRPNVLRHKMLSAQDSERPAHPTPKPVPLMRDLIQHCPPDLIILDPFMGSGTTLRAAKDLGRQAIGIELHNEIGEDGIDRRYCDMAAERLRQAVLL